MPAKAAASTRGDQGGQGTPPGTEWCAAVGQPETAGVCLSGGGIRAASYGLGALQAMQEHGLITGSDKVDYLAAVSGGSYIASALTMIAKGPIDDDDLSIEAAADPFARGTPEEQFVRDHTTYLVHGSGGVFAMVARLLGGVLLNLIFLGLAVHTLFRFAGWFYGWVLPVLRSQGSKSAAAEVAAHIDVHLASWTWLAPMAVAGLGVLAGLISIAVDWDDDGVRKALVTISWSLMGAAAMFALVCVGVPKTIELVRNVLSRVAEQNGKLPANQTQAAGKSTTRLVIGGGAGAAGAIATALLALRARVTESSATVRQDAERWLVKRIKPLLPKLRLIALNGMAALFGPLIILIGAVISLNLGAANTPIAHGRGQWIELVIVGGSLALFLVMRHFGDLNAWSLHAIYKRRLSSTFILCRVRGQRHVHVKARDYLDQYWLSESQSDATPELLVCAAVNVTDYGSTATGSNVAGFVFSADRIGGPLGEMATRSYERSVDGPLCHSVTLPTAMSIAGAAISPAMGKMTRRPLRFLLALLNLRLGVWIPNPTRVQARFNRRLARLKGMEDAGMDPQSEEAKRRMERAAALSGRFSRRPRINYLVREMVGYHRANARFVNVSDGGHYENLGLVELLRRGCTTVWCVDASGEKIDTFGTLAQAIGIARSELGVDIDIDAQSMAPAKDATGLQARYVSSTWAHGTIRYHNGVEGDLVVIKAGVPENAPADILEFHRNAPLFPCDPTSNQLYTYERFDAYRALGYFSARDALSYATRTNGGPVAPPWRPFSPTPTAGPVT